MRRCTTRKYDTKFCTGCGVWKSLSEFNLRADQLKAGDEQYRSRCKACCYVQNRANLLKNPKSSKETQWKAKGIEITYEEFTDLLAGQQGLCGICGKEESAGRLLAVDHDHATGEKRGLLCMSCNTKLGWYEKHLPRITAYLH